MLKNDDMKKKRLYLGENIEQLLREQKLTLRELSAKCGVPYSSLCHMKNNRPPRNLEQLALISACLGVSLYYLLWRENDPHELQTMISKEVLTGVFEIVIKKHPKI